MQSERSCCRLHLFRLLEFLWYIRVAQCVGIEIYHPHADAVFHFAFAEIMQIRTPLRVLFEIICHMLGQQDVSAVPTIHHPLRDVDASAGDVRPFVHVGHFVHWAAMNAHADL